MHGELKIFCGSSNAALGAAMAKSAGSILGEINLKRFSSGEIYAQFLEDVRGRDVFLLQTCVEPVNDNLMELLIMIDAAKRSSAERITVIMPNYFYARQDRKTASRESITAKLVADMITAAGADRVLCIDLHSDQLQGFFDIPLDNLPGRKIFLKKARELSKGNECVVVSPDAGAAKHATSIAASLDAGLAIINKSRPEHNTCVSTHLIGDDVKGKVCFIFDDLIDTAGTVCSASKLLKEVGAKKVFVFATHGVFSANAYKNINGSKIDRLFVSDSIPLAKASEKIEVLSIASYLADAIKCIHNNESVSRLFSD